MTRAQFQCWLGSVRYAISFDSIQSYRQAGKVATSVAVIEWTMTLGFPSSESCDYPSQDGHVFHWDLISNWTVKIKRSTEEWMDSRMEERITEKTNGMDGRVENGREE